MINNDILENCKKRKKNLSTAWIDYRNAFDSVPHSCIFKCLQMYKIHPVLIPHSWILKCIQMYKIHPVLVTFIEERMS